MRDQENHPFLHQSSAAVGKAPKQDALPVVAGLPVAAPFHFSSRRIPVDWRLLHGIDVSQMIRRTDLDTLERVVGIVAFGDLEGEDTCNLTHLNFLRIFRLSQLTAEYLLHVQDHLAGENSHLKEEVTKGAQHVQAVRLRVREQKELLTGANKELRRLRKTLKTYELLAEQAKEQASATAAAAAAPAAAAPAPPAAPPQAPSETPAGPAAGPSQQAGAVVQVDPSTAWELEKLELQAKDMKEEREGLLKDVAKLKAALSQLAARHQGAGAGKEELAAAVARTRREERLAADQRLTQALHAQQQRLQQQHQQQLQQQQMQQSQQQQQQQQAGSARRQDSHLSMSVSEGAEAQALQQKLAEALSRQRELSQQRDALELELVSLKKSSVAGSRQPPARRGSQVMFGADASSPASATAAAAEVKADRLTRELEEAEEQISAMTIKIRQQEKVIAELEQDSGGQQLDASGKLAQQVQADLAQTEAELDAMTKDRHELQAAVDELEEKVAALELEAQRRQLEEDEGADPQASCEAVQRLQQQVGHLTQEVAALDDENRRLSEVIQTDQPHNEELLLHVKELQHEVTVTRAEADEAWAAAADVQATRPSLRLGETFRSFNPAERTSTVLEVEFHPEMSPRPGPLEQGALESPRKLEELDRQEEEEEALAQAEANYNMGPGEDLGPEKGQPEGYPEGQARQDSLEQEYQEQAREARRVARADAAQAAQEGNHVQPLSAVAVRRLRVEMPHELQGHVRQGVMSRFPHSLQDYQSNIEEIQEELQEELTQQLEGYGIDPYAEGLTDEQYTVAMEELGRRRQVLMAGKTPEEQRRTQAMRNNMMWHLNNVGNRVLRSGKLPATGETEGSERAVEGMPRRAGPPPLTSKASRVTVTSIGRETEAEEEQAPRRLLLGRSQQPQGTFRRSLGDSSVPARSTRVPRTAGQMPKSQPRRENSQLVSHQSYIHQDLLAPMSPGHESDDKAAAEAELAEEEEEGRSARAGAATRPGARPVRRRLGGEVVPRLQPQKGAATLRDVREDFTEAKEYHEEVTPQGATSQLQTRSSAVRTARSGLPQLCTGPSNVAFASTQSTLYTQSTLTRGLTSTPSSPLRGGAEGPRVSQIQPRAGQFDRTGQLDRVGQLDRAGPVDRAGPSGRLALSRGVRGGVPPPTPAPSPAGSPSIAAVYKPVQRSPEAQYRASRLRPIQSTKLRPLAQAPISTVAEEAAPAAEESLASDAPSAVESAPGQVEQASAVLDAAQSEAEIASESTQAAVTPPGEGLKTTLSNPMFQPAADDVQPAEYVSKVQELQ